jgi:hypothetical protein
MISNASDFINCLDAIAKHPNIGSCIEAVNGFKSLSSTSSQFLNNIDDDKIKDMLVEVENSAGHFLFSPEGIPDKQMLSRLIKKGYTCIILHNSNKIKWQHTHCIQCVKFEIYFNL